MGEAEVKDRTSSALVLCEFCDARAVAINTEGRSDSRTARCAEHRVLGGSRWAELGDIRSALRRRANDWIRDNGRDLDGDIMVEFRERQRT